ncbi:Zinc finger protein 778 [Anthophora plagiata]
MSLDQGRNDRVSYQVTVPSTSLIEHNEKPLKIEIDYEDSEKCSRNYENEIINDNSSDLMMDSVKTVLVPVRDPVTKEIKNMLVPVEVKDESGLNIIKSVLIPIYDKDGLVSYEIKKVVVPIQPERTQHQTKKVENKVIVNKGKSNQVKCKKEEEEEEEAEAEKEHSPTEDKKKTREKSEKRQQKREPRKKTEEWSKYVSQETPEDLSQVNKPKGEVDHILDTLRNICPFCQRCFENEKKMQRHAVKAHKKPYKCDKCRKGYFTDFGLEEHKKTHEVISVYQCTICQMQYKTMNGLSNHQMREHSNLDPKYTCDYCGKRFKLKVDLRSHIERAHINPMHICRFCGIAVKSITHHELLHEKSKKINASYDCKYCSRKFKVWYNLENHLLMKHKDPRASPDMLRTLFERKFGSRSDFYQHMHNQTEVKQHKCEVCKKTFVSEFSLSNHMTLHAQTFSCAQCSKTVTNKYSLKLHMRTHTGERPYQCKVCLKTFTRSASLRIHGLTHTGERPYVCDLCGQSFTQRSSMMVHRRKHPGDHPRPPPFILRRKRKHANNEH